MFVDFDDKVYDDGSRVINDGYGFRGYGEVGEALGQVRFDPGLRRPFMDSRGETCVMVNTGRVKWDDRTRTLQPVLQKRSIRDLRREGIDNPVWNALSLPKYSWVQLEDAIGKATRLRLKAWTDLSSRVGRGGFNAMEKMTFEYQSVTDAGEAQVDMYGLADGRADRPLIDLKSIPLPITHSDFWFSEREIAVSRRTGMPLDTTMAEQAGRRVAEMIERTLIGVETGITYGTDSNLHTGSSTVWGYTNFPYRILKTDLTTPTGSNPEAVMTDILEMVDLLQAAGFFGPYILYHSTGYSRYLSDDYFRSGSTSASSTLRKRIMDIEGIEDIQRLDYLTSGYQLILAQIDTETIQAINGMNITTVRWESRGGMQQNFKVMCIMVPLLKSRFNKTSSNLTSGIVHGTTA